MNVQEAESVVSAEDLAAIVADVWAAYLLEGGGDSPVPAAATHAVDAEIVHASVAVQGAWVGQIVLELASTSAAMAARAMLGEDEITSSDVIDAVGELANIIGGNVKSLLPPPTTLGLPIVVRGRLAGSSAYAAVEICALDLTWSGEPLRLTVWAAVPREKLEVSS